MKKYIDQNQKYIFTYYFIRFIFRQMFKLRMVMQKSMKKIIMKQQQLRIN